MAAFSTCMISGNSSYPIVDGHQRDPMLKLELRVTDDTPYNLSNHHC